MTLSKTVMSLILFPTFLVIIQINKHKWSVNKHSQQKKCIHYFWLL